MTVEFKDIAVAFKEKDKDLHLPVLNVLVPDAHLYETLAIQPEGQIDVGPDSIGHADHGSAERQFSDFIRLAVEKNCDLVLSPEYSCPWAVLRNAIDRASLPQLGRIWILGCESIKPEELQTFIDEHGHVVWIHEPIPHVGGDFLDVLAYVTKAESSTGGLKDVVVLQFKTQAMGGNTFERDHLICGRKIYFWHNPQDNIRLISLICSEALTFEPTGFPELRFDLYPFIIFHPQLNNNPRQADISNYRYQIFGQRASDNIEVIALNWARNFILTGQPPSPYGGSAIYTKSPEFDTDDVRLEANHQKGLYFTQWHDRRTQLCLFNFDEIIFHFRMPKLKQNVAAVVARRTGPEMLAVLDWDTQAKCWHNSNSIDDGFATLCGTFQQQSCYFCLSTPYKAVDRERLLTLSAGKLQAMQDWHNVKNMDSFITERDERSKRLTFTHESVQASNDFRREYLARYIKLQLSVLANPLNFPPTIHDLRGDWQLQPPIAGNDFRFNLVSLSGRGQGATAIFVDLTPRESVQQFMDNLVREWGRTKTRRLVIWYEFQNAIHYMCPPLPSITDDSEPPASFAGPETP